MARQALSLWDFAWGSESWRLAHEAAIAPVVAVPTTAGTGAEMDGGAVVTDETAQDKKIIWHPLMLPRVVIADPQLTLGLPRHLTAATGMDALSHNLESLCVRAYHPAADGIAVEGIRLIRDFLPIVVREPGNLEARAQMLSAASMGAIAFAKGLGAMHALSHPIGAVFDTHHGLTNAVLMPYVLAYNRRAVEERMVLLARYLDLPRSSFGAVLDWILELRAEIGIPHTLAALGIPDSAAEMIAAKAAADICAPTNPVPVGPPQLAAIFHDALAGHLP
jgi:alcohol dehydrogenase class IV